ncbi:hypothetical protein [Pseudaestuariivita rosea]|uniref:hypothetical protein n=1 Tax=Pseudaestuariivita rosea TaxID=2763263 RepID=UPI001ABB6F6B|nr:hypothetical protein [Pseudaestuariivita rosea]
MDIRDRPLKEQKRMAIMLVLLGWAGGLAVVVSSVLFLANHSKLLISGSLTLSSGLLAAAFIVWIVRWRDKSNEPR